MDTVSCYLSPSNLIRINMDPLDIVLRIPETLWPRETVELRSDTGMEITVGPDVRRRDYNSSSRRLIVPFSALDKPFFTAPTSADDPEWLQPVLAQQHVKFWADNSSEDFQQALNELNELLYSKQ